MGLEGYLQGHDAVHGDPGNRASVDYLLSADCAVAAQRTL